MKSSYISSFVYALLFLSVLRLGSCFGSNYWRYREMLEEHRQYTARLKLGQVWDHSGLSTPQVKYGPPFMDMYLNQPLDHFDPMVKGTYQQRYWVNDDYRREKDAPVFLYIGGEGALNSLTVEAGHHVEMAKLHGALIFAVEHRYYGESINDDGLRLENMQYLSSQQALADLATFHLFASNKFNLTDKNTWICFGGSYPGALSAWFRIKYPHLVYGAVASSAPVHAKVNFEGYNNVVAASLSDPLVKGSHECTKRVKDAFKTVDSMLSGKQFKQLETDFISCKPIIGEHDVFQFVSNLADVFMGTVQYNSETPGQSISSLCETMTKSGEAYHRLVELNKQFIKSSGQNCSDNSWDSMIKMVSNTTLDRGSAGVGVGLRQWIYQTCTQFGYYQTCDNATDCLFSDRMALGPNLDICQIVFKVSPQDVDQLVKFTNAYYGSDQPKGTRIVFVNGSIDPWHALSVTKDLSSSETAIYIPGTAHCADMGSDEEKDPLSLRLARKKIAVRISEWLKEARPTSHLSRYISQ